MSEKDRRLDRLSAGLTARERVVLLQQALYEGRDPDPSIRHTMPEDQEGEFSDYAALANQSNVVLTSRALALYLEVELLQLRWQLLLTQLAWAFDRSSILLDASLVTHVPITRAAYEVRREELRGDRIGVNDAVEIMLIDAPDDSQRAKRQAEKQVRAAIKAGDLPSKRRGRGYQIEYGAFCDWRGEQLEPFPNWGRCYELVADDAVSFAGCAERLQAATESGPHHPGRIHPALAPSSSWSMPEAEQSVHDRLSGAIALRIAQELPLREMDVAALTEVMEAVSLAFEDESIVSAPNRSMLNGACEILASLRESTPMVVGEIDEPATHELLADQIHGQIFKPEIY